MTFELGQYVEINGQNLRVIGLDFCEERIELSNSFDIDIWIDTRDIHKRTVKKYKKLYAA
jgi:hypothetical protein|tara:strand:- start:73 stop:252 length:180 start_codon:yes stop_codon:yes gene_type:complete